MKTLTIKSGQNIPVHSSYSIEIDGNHIGKIKAGATEYFDINENASSIVVKMQGVKSNSIDISENTHHFLMINSKKQLVNGYVFSAIFFIISLCITFLFSLNLELNAMINFALAIILYILFKKSKLNTLQLALIKK